MNPDFIAAMNKASYPQNESKNYLVDQVVKMTAIGHATETLSRVRELAMRLEGLSEAVCGVVPMEASGKGAPTPQPSGILPALQYASEEATDYISRANRALDRINSFI